MDDDEYDIYSDIKGSAPTSFSAATAKVASSLPHSGSKESSTSSIPNTATATATATATTNPNPHLTTLLNPSSSTPSTTPNTSTNTNANASANTNANANANANTSTNATTSTTTALNSNLTLAPSTTSQSFNSISSSNTNTSATTSTKLSATSLSASAPSQNASALSSARVTDKTLGSPDMNSDKSSHPHNNSQTITQSAASLQSSFGGVGDHISSSRTSAKEDQPPVHHAPSVISISGLTWYTTDREVKELVKPYGGAKDINFNYTRSNGMSTGTVLVELGSIEDARRAKEGLHARKIHDATIQVTLSQAAKIQGNSSNPSVQGNKPRPTSSKREQSQSNQSNSSNSHGSIQSGNMNHHHSQSQSQNPSSAQNSQTGAIRAPILPILPGGPSNMMPKPFVQMNAFPAGPHNPMFPNQMFGFPGGIFPGMGVPNPFLFSGMEGQPGQVIMGGDFRQGEKKRGDYDPSGHNDQDSRRRRSPGRGGGSPPRNRRRQGSPTGPQRNQNSRQRGPGQGTNNGFAGGNTPGMMNPNPNSFPPRR